MKQLDILNKIEELLQNSLKSNSSKSDKNTKTTIEMDEETTPQENNTVSSVFKEILNLLVSFLMSVIKIPFQLIQSYIKNEIVAVIKKEMKLYFVLFLLFGVLFIIFIVFWVLISLALGVYLQEQGVSDFNSILYVTLFEVISFLIIVFILYRVTKKMRSISLMNNVLK